MKSSREPVIVKFLIAFQDFKWHRGIGFRRTTKKTRVTVNQGWSQQEKNAPFKEEPAGLNQSIIKWFLILQKNTVNSKLCHLPELN